jgi:hypothetical protein
MYCFRENSNFPFSNQKIITLIEQPLAHDHGDPQNQGSFHKEIICFPSILTVVVLQMAMHAFI